MGYAPENTNGRRGFSLGGLPFARRRDILWLGGALCAAALLFLLLCSQQGGVVAVVSVGSQTQAISLNADGLYAIEGELPVTLEVKDKGIRFVDSVCPDHNCEGFGWLRREGEWALCAPARVMVRVGQAGPG